MRDLTGIILRHASVIGVMLGPQIVNTQNAFVISDLRDANAAGGGLWHQQLIMSVPFERQREVAVSHRTHHGDSLAEPQMLAH